MTSFPKVEGVEQVTITSAYRMFSMIVHCYLRDPKKPIAFVPIYIGYDKVFELGSYLKELSGAAKQKESFSVSAIMEAKTVLW